MISCEIPESSAYAMRVKKSLQTEWEGEVMPIRRINANEIPPRTWDRDPTRTFPVEWPDFLAVLAQGLKPYEAIEIAFDRHKLKDPSGSFLRKAKRHVEKLNLTCDVFRLNGKVYVQGR